MKQLLNTLYVTTRDTKLSVSNNAVVVTRPDSNQKLRIIGTDIDNILCFGNVSVTTPLIQYCGENGISLGFFSEYGRFYGRIEGPVHGNILLRQAQFRLLDSEPDRRLHIIKAVVSGKLRNCREVLVRAARYTADSKTGEQILKTVSFLDRENDKLREENDLETIRGIEGSSAKAYFEGFSTMLHTNQPDMQFSGREQHPPKDKINALMSYVYTLLCNDVRSALEGVGLDPACGFFHTLIPGRPALALDIMEELRSPLCDRLILSLVNRKQIGSDSFIESDGAYLLTDEARRSVIDSWQIRKQETILHPVLKERIPIGMIPFSQAQLLARYIRNENPVYIPFHWR